MEILNSCYVFINTIGANKISLIYYSHLIPIFFVLFLAFLIFFKAPKNVLTKVFFAFSVVFSLWLLADLVTWVSTNYYLIYTSWAFVDYIESAMYILGLYFIFIFVRKVDISKILKYFLFIATLFPLFLTISHRSVLGFNHSVCEAINNNLLLDYRFYLQILTVVVILIYTIIFMIKKEIANRKNSLIVLVSMFLFLTVFGVTSYISAYTSLYEINLYALFIIPIFLISIIYSIFSLDIFRIKELSAYFIVFGLVILTASQLLFITSTTNKLLTIFTVVFSVFLSFILFRNLKKEAEQLRKIKDLSERLESSKMRLEKTNIDLGEANEKLKGLDKLKTEFLSLASHQLRSPLTAIKGYASMLQEGDYGEVTEGAKDTINRIYLSSQSLTKVVEDLLDVTKIEQGGMKYEMAPFDIALLAEEMVKDLSISADKKGLKLEFNKEPGDKFIVNGDKEKIRQVILNLIDNSIKYTKIGGINVNVKKENGKIIISIKDTGMGISKDMTANLFAKFERGEGAKENASGSGLGLYLAKQIMLAHKGRIWAESGGVGKGSIFSIELEEAK